MGRLPIAVGLWAVALGTPSCDAVAPRPSDDPAPTAHAPHPALSSSSVAANVRAAPSAQAGTHDLDAATSAEASARGGERIYVVTGSLDVLASPSSAAKAVGSIRAGGTAQLANPQAGSATDHDCPDGFYPVLPQGFVCGGKGTTRDASAPGVQVLGEYRLAEHAALPASYGVAEMTPVYLRVPTFDEQIRSEPGVEEHLHKLMTMRENEDVARKSNAALASSTADVDIHPSGVEMPDALRGGTFAPFAPKSLLPGSPVTGLLNGGSRVAWVGEFDAADRTWLVTPELLFVPRDKVKRATVSGFHGVVLENGAGVAFTGSRADRQYKTDDKRKFVGQRETWGPQTAVLLAQPASRWSDEKFLETTEPGVYLRADEAIVAVPTAAGRWGIDLDERWIEINAKTQVLLLHEGARISFATLVSVGRNETPRGKYRIFSKHIALPSPFDHGHSGGAKAEVPEVMILSDIADVPPPTAMFAAWWLTSWGVPNSGSGIGLSPLDARRLFDWSSPALPDGWHSVSGEGTWVVVHD